jgi:pimeloyl-ACP methyl ester carboxylesterase
MRTPPQTTMPDVDCADVALSDLADQGLLTTRQLADFQDETGLADLAWRVFWNKSALAEAEDDFRALLRRTHGFVIFMHGWCTTGSVWEHLPSLTCAANPRLVALVPDLNGFGGSPFLAEVPAVEQCDPGAIMKLVTYWVEMLGLRSSQRARRRRRVITFVGHSMGGAALFFLKEREWRKNEFARCAVSPALLIDDELKKGFYAALGIDPWSRRPIEELKTRLSPKVIERLVGVAGQATRAEHLHVFATTPKGTLAQTFYALGASPREVKARAWRNFRIVLAHDDRLLKVSLMLRLLDNLSFGPKHVQVVWGDHYLFSVSDETHQVHMRNREVVLGEILYLHEACREGQRA